VLTMFLSTKNLRDTYASAAIRPEPYHDLLLHTMQSYLVLYIVGIKNTRQQS
jgi:hypothetical protein